MNTEFIALLYTAIGISLLHTLAGPDHYLPFIVLSRAKGWSMARTMGWTLICGLGHVGSSVVLGLLGALLGWTFSELGWFEQVRGGVAGWALLVFGFLYTCYGMYTAWKGKKHQHFETDGAGGLYVYEHKHAAYAPSSNRHKVTPWVLFIIFVLGPCEPMIPLLYAPGARASWVQLSILILVYSVCTLLAMTLMVWMGYMGLSFRKTDRLERYMHALAGLAILTCGIGMVFLAW